VAHGRAAVAAQRHPHRPGTGVGGDDPAGPEQDAVPAGGAVGSEHGHDHLANGLDEPGPITYDWRVAVQANSQTNPAGGPDLVAMLDGWSSTGHGALPRRLAHALRHVVNAGVLPSGWRLPPERRLAGALSVSRATITQALDELRGEGLLTSMQGSGTYVRAPSSPSPVGTRVAEHLLTGPGIDLATGNPPDLSHLPPASVDMTLLNAAGGGPGVNAFGLPAMRQAIADLYTAGRLSGSPRPTDAEEIHITSGAHQAVALLVASLTGRGQAVAFAEVNYPGIFDIIDGLEARAAPVRTDRAGMLPESLEDVITTERPPAIYVQAGPHNPTGTITPVSRQRALASVLDRHGVTVIEDATLAPLAYHGPVPLLTELCRSTTVVSIESLSKTCWAGLRLGWMRGSAPVVEQTMFRHLAFDLGPSVPSQLLALGLLPTIDEIVAERRHRLATAVGFAAEQLAALIPEAEFTDPDGGSVLWVRFPVADSEPLVRHARRFGVRTLPGSIHVTGRAPGPYVRICVDRPLDHVGEGIGRLARAWRDLCALGGQPGPPGWTSS
jgi:DNA-binding transcriptional MocR family regulator